MAEDCISCPSSAWPLFFHWSAHMAHTCHRRCWLDGLFSSGGGTGATASELHATVTCQAWKAVYPMTSPSVGLLSRILLVLPTIGAIYAAFTINKSIPSKQAEHHKTVEIRAVQLGFSRAVLQSPHFHALYAHWRSWRISNPRHPSIQPR